MTEPFDSPLVIFSKEGFENIYILESDNNRLVVLTDEGEFLKEIKSASLASASNLIVSEEIKKAFAISGSIVYEIGL